MFRQVYIALACLFLAFAANNIQAQDDLQSLAKKLRLGVVSVVAYDKNGDVLSHGYGFFITRTSVNGKLLREDKGETVQVLTRQSLLPIEAARTEIRTFDGQSYKITGILDENKDADLATVAVDLSQRLIAPLTISGAVPVVSQPVIVLSSSTAPEQAMIEGAVSAIQNSPAGKIVQMVGRISDGLAGSPVFSMNGEVVGVVRSQREGEKVFSANVGNSLLRFVHPVLQPPRLLNNPEPGYTLEARRAGVEGSVHMRVLIGTDGSVKRVNLTDGLPGGLDDEALKAAYRMKFEPAMVNGRPVEFWKPVVVEFRLRR
jgi:TonB family protein